VLKIEKSVLAKLDGVYAVSTINLWNKTHFLAATESHGEGLIFSPPDWRASLLWDGPGGVMCMVGIPGTQGALLSVQKFFPIFQSDDAEIAVSRWSEEEKAWRTRSVGRLPFVHRIEIVGVGGTPYVVAGTLCGGKAYQDDWSRPGAVCVAAIPDADEGELAFETVITGIAKNHGMHKTSVDGRPAVFVSGQEGVFCLKAPEAGSRVWRSERVLDREVSDMWMYDIDGDGRAELLTIESFHGNVMSIYKLAGATWTPVFSKSIDFGHVVFGGQIAGRAGIVVGSRGGRKDLEMLFPTFQNGRLRMDQVVLDGGVGAAQIAVVGRGTQTLVLSANHATGEVALYALSDYTKSRET
jgi:hypothetical protein